jgi:hypothetical protein
MARMFPAGHPLARLVPTTRGMLVLLLLGDLLLILAHVVHVWTPWLAPTVFSVERDGGFPELYQYLKLFFLACCLLVVALRTRGWVLAVWGVFFALLMVDDAFQLHERLGDVIGPALGIPAAFGLRTDDYGEIAYAVLLGLCAVAFVALTFRRGSPESRQVSADLLCLLCALGVFAIFFDTLHTMAYFRMPSISPPLALLEDGGEMIVISLIAAYVFGIVGNDGKPRFRVYDRVRERLTGVSSSGPPTP